MDLALGAIAESSQDRQILQEDKWAVKLELKFTWRKARCSNTGDKGLIT